MVACPEHSLKQSMSRYDKGSLEAPPQGIATGRYSSVPFVVIRVHTKPLMTIHSGSPVVTSESHPRPGLIYLVNRGKSLYSESLDISRPCYHAGENRDLLSEDSVLNVSSCWF